MSLETVQFAASDFNNLEVTKQGKPPKADPLYRLALAIDEERLWARPH
jgi:hypothetical protein